MWFDARGGDNPMVWVHAGGANPPMGFHATQAVVDYVKKHGFAELAYHRKTMQRQLDAIAAALPATPRPADGSLQIGDLVRVGTGKVAWSIRDITKFGIARLSSTTSVIGRSEMLSNLKPLPPTPASHAPAAAKTAITNASRTVLGAGGLAVAAAVAGATLGAIAVVRYRRTARPAMAVADQTDAADERSGSDLARP